MQTHETPTAPAAAEPPPYQRAVKAATPRATNIEPLWTVDDIATYLQTSDDTVRRIVVREFPRPVVLPSRGKGAHQDRRWFSTEVIAWADQLRSPPQ